MMTYVRAALFAAEMIVVGFALGRLTAPSVPPPAPRAETFETNDDVTALHELAVWRANHQAPSGV